MKCRLVFCWMSYAGPYVCVLKRHPSISPLAWVDNDWISFFGWTVSLKVDRGCLCNPFNPSAGASDPNELKGHRDKGANRKQAVTNGRANKSSLDSELTRTHPKQLSPRPPDPPPLSVTIKCRDDSHVITHAHGSCSWSPCKNETDKPNSERAAISTSAIQPTETTTQATRWLTRLRDTSVIIWILWTQRRQETCRWKTEAV